MGILHGFVPNEGDVWQYTSDVLRRFYEQTAASSLSVELPATINSAELMRKTQEEPPEELHDLFNSFLEDARLLGERTAQMHLTLSRGAGPAFVLGTVYDALPTLRLPADRGLTRNVIPTLARRTSSLPEGQQEIARRVLGSEQEIVNGFRKVLERKLGGVRIRCHGDFHLGQVLHTGRDFSIIDFEGEPARSLGERRLKRSPLTDVAGMLRSFHYAAFATLFDALRSGLIRQEDAPSLDPWARFWTMWVSAYYLRGYLATEGISAVLPLNDEDLQVLLDAYILEKAVYEVGYELNSRPDWVGIPLNGILQTFGESV